MAKKKKTETTDTDKALKALGKMSGKADPDVSLSARASAKWLLSQKAKNKGGNPIIMDGRELTNLDVAVFSLLQAPDVSSKSMILTLGGAMDAEDTINEQEKKKKDAARQKRKRAVEKYKRNEINRLKRSGMWDVTLTGQVDVIADLRQTIEDLREKLTDADGQINIEVSTTSREGAKRVYSRNAAIRLTDLQCRLAKLEKTLLDSARTLQEYKDRDDDSYNEGDAITLKINKLLNDDY